MEGYKRLSKDDMRKALDADNMDSKVSLVRVCNLVSANVVRVIEELTERAVVYELLAVNPEGKYSNLLPEFIKKRDDIFDFATTVISTAAVLGAALSAISASGADQYLFVNRFLDAFENDMKHEDNHAAKMAYIAILAANTAEFAEKVANGQTA